jgi:RES domain-containing protein
VTVHLWRIASDTPDWTAAELEGHGAAAEGGRWNHEGEHVVYASASISLAAWETRTHLGRAGIALPWNRFVVRLDVPGDVWAARTALPQPWPVGWNAMPEGAVSRSIGSAWLAAGASALLVVPSVIVEEESNVLLNPSHPDARRIFAVKTRRFLFDPRV